MNFVDAIVLLAYATLAVELLAFPIPSEASTWQLLASTGEPGRAPDDVLQRARARPLLRKVVVYFVPTAIGVLLWLLPLACTLAPAVADAVGAQRIGVLQVPGALLVALGRAVTFASVLQLRAQRRGGAPGWLFRRSRNPGLVGMFTCYAGLCCVHATPLLLLGLPIYVANMHNRVRIEEAHLRTALGATWADYAARVPRYLGRRTVA